MNRANFELGVTKEIAMISGFIRYNANIISKLVQKQKWIKKIKSASVFTNEGKQKIIRLFILHYLSISNTLQLEFSDILKLP